MTDSTTTESSNPKAAIHLINKLLDEQALEPTRIRGQFSLIADSDRDPTVLKQLSDINIDVVDLGTQAKGVLAMKDTQHQLSMPDVERATGMSAGDLWNWISPRFPVELGLRHY